MSDILLNELAKELNKSAETLVKQFADAGITKSASDKVTLKEKETLTTYLQKQHGGEQKKKMTLQRKTKKSLLLYAIPLLAGLAITHSFIPPTPGPVAVADILKADVVAKEDAVLPWIFVQKYWEDSCKDKMSPEKFLSQLSTVEAFRVFIEKNPEVIELLSPQKLAEQFRVFTAKQLDAFLTACG